MNKARITAAISAAYGELPARMGDPLATRMLVAVQGQENTRQHAHQQDGDDDPWDHAVGLWQFERAGVVGVMSHSASRDAIRAMTVARGIEGAEEAYRALATDDALAAAFARLLLWTLPEPLPENMHEGWTQYLAAWRPGKPHLDRWPGNWAEADREVFG